MRKISAMATFQELGITGSYIKALKDLDIKTPTRIQEQAIPALLDESGDFIGQGQTGTGKTAAFGLPILNLIEPDEKYIQAIILCPTRELGKQIAKQLFRFTKYGKKIFTEAVYGGEKIDKQIDRLKRPTHIIVATPGRLKDLMERKDIDISKVRYVILDEADEMLKMGFKEEVFNILRGIENRQRTWLFSATFPSGVNQIIERFMDPNATRINVKKDDVVNENIEHQFVVCEPNEKFLTLREFLKAMKKQKGIIFTRTKASANEVHLRLQESGVDSEVIHGDLDQKERDKAMRAFKNRGSQIMVATDLSARGIDIKNLAFVAHYELPDQSDYYTHRSGRTARGGARGISIAFVSYNEIKALRDYERVLNIEFRQLKG